MIDEYGILPKINRIDLVKAKKYTRVFLELLTEDMIDFNTMEIMPGLNSSRETLLAYHLLEPYQLAGVGVFFRLIHDGFDGYVFEKPFSKILKKWGAKKLGRFVDKARIICEKHKSKIEEIKTMENSYELYPEKNDFELLEHELSSIWEDEGKKIRKYIEKNIDEFATIDENNTQISFVDNYIKEIEDRIKMIDAIKEIERFINPKSLNPGNRGPFISVSLNKNAQPTDITVNENNTMYSSIDGVLFNKERTALLKYPEGRENKDYTVPDRVITIGRGAFKNCSNLQTITLSRKTKIKYKALESFSGKLIYRD